MIKFEPNMAMGSFCENRTVVKGSISKPWGRVLTLSDLKTSEKWTGQEGLTGH